MKENYLFRHIIVIEEKTNVSEIKESMEKKTKENNGMHFYP